MQEVMGYASPEAFSQLLPPWEQCPGQLNFRLMVWLLSLLEGWDMRLYAERRFNLLGNGGNWFPGAAPQELANVSDEEIRAAGANLPQPERLAGLLRKAVASLEGASQQRESKS